MILLSLNLNGNNLFTRKILEFLKQKKDFGFDNFKDFQPVGLIKKSKKGIYAGDPKLIKFIINLNLKIEIINDDILNLEKT